MMLKTIFLITVSLCCLITAQDAEVELLLGMRSILDQLERLTNQMGEQDRKMEESIRSVKQTVEEQDRKMEESLQSLKQTVEDLRVEYQQCARRSQLDTFQNVFNTGQQEILSSLQQCPCRDEITDIQELLATDECRNGEHNCSEMATCTDTPGFYQCTCLPRYTGDGFTCQDIDECTSGSYQCHPNATCVNTDGSYRCQCHPLYSGDGHTCDPICELPSLLIPSLGCITLVSDKGEFKADDSLDGKANKLDWHQAQSKCQESGRELLRTVTRQQLEKIMHHFHPFMGGLCCAKVGVRHGKWIANNLPVASGLWNSHSGEPTGGDEECGYVGKNNDGNIHLYDGQCTGTSYALCQHHY